MNLEKTAIRLLVLLVMAHAGTSYAERVEHACSAKKFVPCPSFRTSRTIGEHTPIIDNHIAGFTRSKGQWTITVGYGPAEKCAKVSFWVDMGPLDFDREYKRVFMNGGGAISDSGSFMHKIDDVESALRVHNSSCYVPAPEPQKTEAESKERQALEGEREQQELDEERERLALEQEQERQELEGKRERLALEEEQRRLAQEQQRLEQERERRRLAKRRREREQQRLAQERQRRRLAQQRRGQERQRAERRSQDNTMAVMGFLKGLAGGVAELEDSGNPGMAVLKGLADGLSASSGMDLGGSSPSSGGGGGSCEQAKRRVDQRNVRTLASLSRNARGQCAVSRGYVQMFQNAQRDLARSGCPASVARMFDQPLAQARQRVRATCN